MSFISTVPARRLHLSLLFMLIAGFCDAATFVSSAKLLSAHVAGNLIILLYSWGHQAPEHFWLQLLSLPVFLVAVAAGYWLGKQLTDHYMLLLLEGGLLLSSGVLVVAGTSSYLAMPELHALAVLGIVFAMGLQSAFRRLFRQEVYEPAALTISGLILAALRLVALMRPASTTSSLATHSSLIAMLLVISFLIGCLLGLVGGLFVGLGIVAAPGILLLFFVWSWSASVTDRAN
jgi:uncharacterized membrane protein YoaK (UPF0700 family)